MTIAAFGPWVPRLRKAERLARWRSLRALAVVFVGPDHPLVSALRVAETDKDAASTALEELDALSPLSRRRLLATYATVCAPERGPGRGRRRSVSRDDVAPRTPMP